jgi:3-oxoacyl-[acyl-carrier protein] reductase
MTSVVLVTGSASGIGRAVTTRLYAAGHAVVATDVNAEGLRAAARGWSDAARVLLRPLDVRDPGAWRAAIDEVVARFGHLDTLVNVAGVLVPIWAHEAADRDVDFTVDVNVKGLMHGTNAALRHMVPRGAGQIVNVASVAGLVPVPGLALYSASKHAARAYSIAVAQEVRKHGVFVTAVCPTLVQTPMMDAQLGHEEAAFAFSGRRPLTVDEVSAAIVDRAMVKKPLELIVDVPGSAQGLAAKIGNLVPGLSMWAGQWVARMGLRGQERAQKQFPAPR